MAGPPSKRARTVPTEATRGKRSGSGGGGGLFQPFRSLGQVSTSCPLFIQSRSSKHLTKPSLTVLTSLGTSWAMWTGDSFRLLFVGPDLTKQITSLTVQNESTFAASGNTVYRFVRGKQIGQFIVENSQDEDQVLSELVLFGNTLVGLERNKGKMYVWDIPTYSNPASKDPLLEQEQEDNTLITPYSIIEFPHGFTPTKVIHPASYLNKVVVASKQGELAIYNVRTASLIHTFKLSTILPTSSSSSSSSNHSITALSQSPAIDVLGIGYSSGSCVLFDVRMGESLGKVELQGDGDSSEQVKISSISFRNDDLAQTVCLGTESGHVALFDLNQQMKLLHLVRNCHEGPVTGLEWVVGQPLFMTSGPDNSVKQWLLDTPTAQPRLLKQRSGHHEPPHLVRYYGQDGKSLLTAAKDHSLRLTSVVRDSRGYELSQGSILKKSTRLDVKRSSLKLPLITSLSYSNSRSKDWDDVLTVSNQEDRGRTWSVDNKKLGKFTFPAKAGGKVTTSTVTSCGNFGLVGTDQGHVVAYNMQSGLQRKLFQVTDLASASSSSKHVTGVAVDALNRVVVVATLKGVVNFFDFQTMKLLSTLSLKVSITSILLQRDNSLLAVICDDLTVRIIDIETKRVVRELSGGTKGQILDLTFSQDSRWLITTSQDSIIRTFDVPSGNLIDQFRTRTVATSLSFSPTGDFLATTHVDSVGIYLWANRAQFAEVSLLKVVEQQEDEEISTVDLPTVQGLSTDDDETLTAISAPTKWSEILQPYTTPDQLSDELVTLSLMPRSKWQTLLNLETIKQRNKPKEQPKQPERAPFFLPTLPGTSDTRFDFGVTTTEKNSSSSLTEEGKKRKLDYTLGNSIETEFVRRLLAENQNGTYQTFFEYLKALSPSALDLEIRSLTTLPHLRTFLHSLLKRFESHRDFEATETFLAVFLRIHGDVLISNPQDGIREKMLEIQKEQKKEAERLIDLTHYNLGTLAFLRGVALT